MLIPIFTSIPYSFYRTENRTDVGENYLRKCVQSWQNYGFSPVTVNSKHEKRHPIVDEMGIRVLTLNRDASSITGRPHIFMSDLWETAFSHSKDKFFVINADIELNMSKQVCSLLHNLESDYVVMAHRMEYDLFQERSHSKWLCRNGIDFVGGGKKALGIKHWGKLVFGMPYWDDFITYYFKSKGEDIKFLRQLEFTAWHLSHNERWNSMHKKIFGSMFVDLLLNKTINEGWIEDSEEYNEIFKNLRKGIYCNSRSISIWRKWRKYFWARAFPQSNKFKRFMFKELVRLSKNEMKQITCNSVFY